jgi:MFS family permease
VSTDSRDLREVLSGRDLRRLLSVRMTGQFADGLFQAALFSAVFFNPERATSAGEAAAAFATLLLPYSLVGPFAGVFLDRWRRQRVLLTANLARAAAVVVFATLLAVLGPTSPPVVGLALVVISANRFILAGLSAALPHVVAPRVLVTANSFSTTLGAGAAAAGGATALGLRTVFGDDDLGASRVALCAAALYVVAGVLASRMAADLLGPDDPPLHIRVRAALAAVASGVVQGARHVPRPGVLGG